MWGGVGFSETFATSHKTTWHHITECFIVRTLNIVDPYFLSGIFMKPHSQNWFRNVPMIVHCVRNQKNNCHTVSMTGLFVVLAARSPDFLSRQTLVIPLT
jgi:hypothetical protein